MRHLESKAQAAVFMLAAYAMSKYPDLKYMHSSLNGVHLTSTQAKIAKGQGMLAGVSDIFLPTKRGNYSGLYIEMKVKPNILTDAQIKYMEYVKTQDYYAEVCYSWHAAKDLIINYLENKLS